VPAWGLALAGIFMAVAVPAGLAHAQSMTMGEMLNSSSLLLLHSRSQGFLGVDVGDVDQDRVQALHLKDTHGAEITVLDHDAPAGKVGLKLHDVILEVNGQAIDGADQMKQLLHETPPGRKAATTGEPRRSEDVRGRAVGRPAQGAGRGAGAAGQLRLDIGDGQLLCFEWRRSSLDRRISLAICANSLHVGTIVEPLAPQMADFLGVSGGVMIKSVARKSSADAAGLRAHDVVLGVGGEAVVTTSDWERLLRTAEGKPVQVEIMRDRMKQLVLMQVDGKRHKS
jgi:serine protease Do